MVNLEGLNEVLAILSALGGNVKESARKGLESGAKKVQGNAKILCPTGKTGQLKNSIKTKSEITQEGARAQVFTNVEYAPYVEFGTGQRGAESNIDRPDGIAYKADWSGQAAQPYLTPAYLHAKNTGEVEEKVIKSVQQDIRKLGVVVNDKSENYSL